VQGKLIGCLETTVGMTPYIRKACDSAKKRIHLDRRSLDVETLGFKLHKSGCCTLQRGNIYSSGFSRGIDFVTVSSIFIFIIF